MIIDVFPFYNEIELLTYRLDILYPYVDKFVITESTKTFSGNEKKLYFNENKEKFEKYADKIIHLIDPDLDSNSVNSWKNEYHQRNYPIQTLRNMNLSDRDIIINTDLDEIPNPNIIANITTILNRPIMALQMDLYYYTLEYKVDYLCGAPKVMYYGFLKNINNIEASRNTGCPVINNGGWHMSFFGNPEFIINKLKSYAHTEYSNLVNNSDEVNKYISSNQSIIPGLKITYIPLDQNSNLPPNYQNYKLLTTI